MEEEDFIGCISCMSTNDLCDLFAPCGEEIENYAKMFELCFNIKIPNDLKYICSNCAEKLETAFSLRDQTSKSLAMIQSIRDEEYLDESILEDENGTSREKKIKKLYLATSALDSNDENVDDDFDDVQSMEALDETTCMYCSEHLASVEDVQAHIKRVHASEIRASRRDRECTMCGVVLNDATDHADRCQVLNSEKEVRQYPCHFCENIYNTKKACFTHLRMKHGLKLCTDQPAKYTPRERKKCHICNRDFSQKQILNKHLLKAHGLEVEKRKAFICPLCDARVSYGSHFSAHLLREHMVQEEIERLEFQDMDDFMLYKSVIQEETKCRFRKTTASKQTIEGMRSHYMCSQSGVYVYQGKGKRPAPERQIYKTGKACPAHMIVTETIDRVLVTFYKTHVGHGACPYYEPREAKKSKYELGPSSREKSCENDSKEDDDVGEMAWVCDSCGVGFLEFDKFKSHVASHGLKLCPCQYCNNVFQNIDALTRHTAVDHGMGRIF